MFGLAGQSHGVDKGVLEENIICKNSANRSIMSALLVLVAIVCFGRGSWVRGFVEIKILDQNLTLLKVTAHTWAIFFPKNRFVSFFDIL